MTKPLQPFDCGQQAAVVVTRGEIVESEHFVCYALVDAHGRVIESNGDIDRPTYMRSSAKPLIATAVVASGAADRYGFTPQEIAIAAGSHSGEPKHVDAVQDMLRKVGLSENALRCGAHAPTHQPSAEALCLSGHLPQPVHNNCSGKHAGILALARFREADTESYLSADNPAEREILNVCSVLLEIPVSQMIVGVDGCGIPVIAVPLKVAAHFYARLGELRQFPEPLAGALGRVRDAMLSHPDFVAGTNRFDTDLMRAADGTILAKGGAEGYHGSGALQAGLGLTVKVADGNYRAVAPFVIDRLAAHNVLESGAIKTLAYTVPKVRNHAGKIVGEIETV